MFRPEWHPTWQVPPRCPSAPTGTRGKYLLHGLLSYKLRSYTTAVSLHKVQRLVCAQPLFACRGAKTPAVEPAPTCQSYILDPISPHLAPGTMSLTQIFKLYFHTCIESAVALTSKRSDACVINPLRRMCCVKEWAIPDFMFYESGKTLIPNFLKVDVSCLHCIFTSMFDILKFVMSFFFLSNSKISKLFNELITNPLWLWLPSSTNSSCSLLPSVLDHNP